MRRRLLAVLGICWALMPFTERASALPGFPSLYQSKVQKHCSAATKCEVAFSGIPSNRLLRATNINCLAVPTVQNPQTVEQVTFLLFTGSLTGDADVFDNFAVAPAAAGQPFRFSVNETILTFFQGGTRPKLVVFMDLAANTDLFCKLTGELVSP